MTMDDITQLSLGIKETCQRFVRGLFNDREYIGVVTAFSKTDPLSYVVQIKISNKHIFSLDHKNSYINMDLVKKKELQMYDYDTDSKVKLTNEALQRVSNVTFKGDNELIEIGDIVFVKRIGDEFTYCILNKLL